ncbi:MAG: multiheme c-type cytochrome [Bacteroidetes bacterium]|nr:multiheme c-type cytochrome [Bacteroidota bacterium]
MLKKLKYRRSVLVLVVLTSAVFLLVQCAGNDKKTGSAEGVTSNPRYEAYAASEQCASCHKDIYEKHLTTAHHLTGQPANAATIMGSFEEGKNNYSYTPSILLSMQKRDSEFYQVAFYKGEEKKAMRFDMVIGSGVMGESYLNWRGNRLYQLPITFFTAANQWANSPGFPNDRVLIDRPVTARCLECHISYATPTDSARMEPLSFDRNQLIYGVDCQKCHGPAAAHVEYQSKHPEDKQGKFIVNPVKLSRSKQMDICALCHGGNIQKTTPSFSFKAGDDLSDHFIIDTSTTVLLNSPVDVHGNQVGLLKASKCFRMTQTLTCNSCHNTHENQRGKTELFSQKCTGCHNTTDATFRTATHQQVQGIEKNCIDCHMPAQPSKSIAVKLQGQDILKASLLRTHYIGIYPEEIKKYIQQKQP